MSCSLGEARPDWKAYAFGEMTAEARQNAEAHASDCSECHQEWSGLTGTLAALSSLREEAVPRRIAFVSDKVFEPRWWQAYLRPAFLGTSLLAGAILVHALVRPGSTNAGAEAALRAAVTQEVTQEITRRVTQEVTRNVQQQMQEQMAASLNSVMNTAVTKAVAETRQADDRRTTKLLAAAETRYQETAEFLNRQVTRIYAMNSGAGVR